MPVQPAETQARQRYDALIEAFPDLAINADARFELAELLAEREQARRRRQAPAGALEAEKEPAAELAEIKVRLAACLLDRGHAQGARGDAQARRGRSSPPPTRPPPRS